MTKSIMVFVNSFEWRIYCVGKKEEKQMCQKHFEVKEKKWQINWSEWDGPYISDKNNTKLMNGKILSTNRLRKIDGSMGAWRSWS